MITLIDDVEIFAPERRGKGSILLLGDRIAAIGPISRSEWNLPGIEIRHVAGSGLIALPGLIDPHEHLIGGSGESGFGSQTPEIFLRELISAGITTVVGCLGVDTSTRNMAALVGKVKGLREQGVSAFAWTGGYPVPSATLTGSLVNDILYVQEIIGAGEIAISDLRSSHPDIRELARVVGQVRNAGLLAGKAGITHFHVGGTEEYLRILHAMLNDFSVDPHCVYATHVERTETLMLDAIALAGRGATVDMDTYEEDMPRWVRFYFEQGGDPRRLTLSTDAAINSPHTLLEQVAACVQSGQSMEQILALVTSNTADVLKLKYKGRLEVGRDADLVLLRSDDLSLSHVIGSGKLLFEDGELTSSEPYLQHSNRTVNLNGIKRQPRTHTRHGSQV
jgi:beta-aspartyl-dipeptidase (metallo-type)